MDLLWRLYEWASDPKISTALGTLVAVLGIPGGIWGLLKLFRKPKDEQLSQIEDQLRVLHATMVENAGHRGGAPHSHRRFALLIGNGAYALAALKNARADVEKVAATLRDVGFETVVQTDLSRTQFLEAIGKFRSTIAHGGIGLVYFAGHGMEVNGSNLLLPVDVKLGEVADVEHSSVNLTELMAPIESFVQEHPKDSGSIVLYSTSEGTHAADGRDVSPFADAFIRAISAPHRSLADFFRQVQAFTRVATMNEQHPEMAGLSDIEFSFTDKSHDSRIGIIKIIVIDTSRVNPFHASGVVR